MAQTSAAPGGHRVVNTLNKVIVGLQKVGIVFGPMQLITAPGRKSGQPRTAPVAVITIEGLRYVFQAYPKAAWVANVRAADTVTLARGRTSGTVRLTELPVEQRRPLLRELVATSPASVGKRFATNGLAESASPDSVAAAAERIAVFRVDPA
jgi:deazaflavin-dependent oxidoreductase (nitroreductase family)